jgi:pyruvate dehydrogenase (quinone)
MPTVAQHIIAALKNGFTGAIRRSEGISWEHVRHEQTAAFAAGADAAITGRLGVCAGSCGPGNLHVIKSLGRADELLDLVTSNVARRILA